MWMETFFRKFRRPRLESSLNEGYLALALVKRPGAAFYLRAIIIYGLYGAFGVRFASSVTFAESFGSP